MRRKIVDGFRDFSMNSKNYYRNEILIARTQEVGNCPPTCDQRWHYRPGLRASA
jgi:hypothetical protein